MQFEFRNNQFVSINRNVPNTISSQTPVSDVDGTASGVTIELDILHTFTGDLILSLEAPDGSRVRLVNREGGRGNHFLGTVFDDRSESSITRARPPFSGRFKPAESLSQLDGVDPNGNWTLVVEDRAFRDGGGLLGWTLGFAAQPEPVTSNYTVDVQFLGGLRPSQEDVFMQAARRWQEIILGDGNGDALTVTITAEGVPIDLGGTPGEGNVLGQARPTHVFTSNGLIARGLMEFDEFDLDRMEADGSLLNVIIHEMGHVLGHGTLWGNRGLLVGAGTFNPRFVGINAMEEFRLLQGGDAPTPVPVANTGGAGTQDSHWRESTFGNELLTGRLNGGINPISRMSIASIGDLGYSVNLDAAEPYNLPSPQLLAQLGTEGSGSCCCSCPHHGYTGQLEQVGHSH